MNYDSLSQVKAIRTVALQLEGPGFTCSPHACVDSLHVIWVASTVQKVLELVRYECILCFLCSVMDY